METKDERRKRKLSQLCNDHGGVKVVAQEAGLGWEALDQVLKGTPLPVKRDGTRSARALGDPAAEAIEDAFGLGRGWFDWPFDLVDYKRYCALTEPQQSIVQDQMNREMERFEKEPSAEDRARMQKLRTRKTLAAQSRKNG